MMDYTFGQLLTQASSSPTSPAFATAKSKKSGGSKTAKASSSASASASSSSSKFHWSEFSSTELQRHRLHISLRRLRILHRRQEKLRTGQRRRCNGRTSTTFYLFLFIYLMLITRMWQRVPVPVLALVIFLERSFLDLNGTL